MVSCRQPLTFLHNAQEIKVDYKDIERIQDFVSDEWTSTADIVIYVPKDQVIEWGLLEPYRSILKIIIAVEDASLIEEAHMHNYKAFWSYPAATFWELRGLLDLGADQVLLDAPLYFNLIKVKNICGEVEIRLVVNKCINNYMMRKDGICGTYVRPEDVEVYEEYVSHMEFDTPDLQAERTLYKVYAEQKNWPGNLNLLLTYLNENVDNRGFELLPTEDNDIHYFAHRRINCGQRCQEDPTKCSYCVKAFNLINAIDKNSKRILEQIEKAEAK